MNIEQEIQQGELARQALENPVLKKAFQDYREHLFNLFKTTRFKDSEDRDEIWRKMQCVDVVENDLKQIIETGQLARQTLFQKTKKVGRCLDDYGSCPET